MNYLRRLLCFIRDLGKAEGVSQVGRESLVVERVSDVEIDLPVVLPVVERESLVIEKKLQGVEGESSVVERDSKSERESQGIERESPAVERESKRFGRPDALSLSVLKKAPLDILLHIKDYLPSVSAVALSLSCMHLKCLLGSQHFIRVASSTEHTLALLKLLALDLPNQVVCSFCKRLHTMNNMRRYNSSTYSSGRSHYQYQASSYPACVSQDRLNHTGAITELFGVIAFKMAMKRYLQQPEDIELLEIMSSKKATTLKVGDHMRRSKEECRVVQGHLMHRLQSVHLTEKDATTISFNHHPPDETICPHIKFGMSDHDIGSGVTRCRKCRTEYRIDFKYYSGHGMALFFTRWKDLGTDPEGVMWKQHLPLPQMQVFRELFIRQKPRAENLISLENRLEPRPQDRDLCSAFEESGDFKFDPLPVWGNETELFRFPNQLW